MIDFEFEFQYAEEKQPTLQKVGGSIPAGRCVVLCGGSGCGKSTLLPPLRGGAAAGRRVEGLKKHNLKIMKRSSYQLLTDTSFSVYSLFPVIK